MKRSKTTALLLMSAAPLLFTACEREAKVQQDGLYTSVEACAAQTHDITTCQQALKQAQQQSAEQGPKYASREQCTQDYAADRCVEQRDSQGHSFIGPLMTGFFLSQMFNGNRGAGFNSAPAFQDRQNQWQRPAAGAGAGTAGAATALRGNQTMSHIGATPNRAVTVSRGGFGGASSTRSVGG